MATATPPITVLPQPEHVHLPGVSFATYDALVNEVGDRRDLRFTYDHGRMEIMSPTQDRERWKKLLAQMIEVLTEELGIRRMSCGSTTFKDERLDGGLEPDECYYIQNEPLVRGKKIKLGVDPSPDLVLEVDVTSSVIDRFPIYAALGFPEIGQYVDGAIVIQLLQPTGQYAVAQQSRALPMVSVVKLVEHLERCNETDETTWIRKFRRWVQGGMK